MSRAKVESGAGRLEGALFEIWVFGLQIESRLECDPAPELSCRDGSCIAGGDGGVQKTRHGCASGGEKEGSCKQRDIQCAKEKEKIEAQATESSAYCCGYAPITTVSLASQALTPSLWFALR